MCELFAVYIVSCAEFEVKKKAKEAKEAKEERIERKKV